MKKVIPYILIVIVLLVGAGLYLQSTKKTGESILPVTLKTQESFSDELTVDSPPEQLFKNYGPAPDFVGNDKWFNSEPLKMEQLKGKVVLVDFWTYSCINCIRTFPYITEWYKKYKDQGLEIVGVHTPEFAFEKVPMNVEAAIKKYGISYPVAQDNNYKTWTAYKNQFWPAHYLIDKDGNIVYTHFGEGKYDVTEKAIRTLLGLEGEFQIPQQEPANLAATPEIYFGLTRLKNFGGTEKPSGEQQIYTFPSKLKPGHFALEGSWVFNQEAAIHTKGFGRIKLNFDAAKVFMVAQSNQPTTIKVYVDGKLIKGVVVKDSDLYELYNSMVGGQHTMEIEIPDGNFEAFTFTFG